MSVAPQAPGRAGPIFSLTALELGAVALLRNALPAYLDEVAAQWGWPDPIVACRSITRATEFARFVEDQLPAIVVASPGTLGPPTHVDGHTYEGMYALIVGAAVSTATQESTHDLVRLWGAAIRACVPQNVGALTYASDVDFFDEDYTRELAANRRTIAAVVLTFRVRVQNLVDAWAGPAPPRGVFPSVETAEVAVDIEEVLP